MKEIRSTIFKAGSAMKKARANQGNKMLTFKARVVAVPQIATAYQPGVQALPDADRNRLKNAQVATGSIDLDKALRCSYPNAPRWDYGIGLPNTDRTEKVLWLEVHHAASGETDRVIKKLNALKTWLQAEAPDLWAMPRIFVWQLSNVESNPNDRRKRTAQAENHGLRRVQGKLDLGAL
jgi:hypothetical protein